MSQKFLFICGALAAAAFTSCSTKSASIPLGNWEKEAAMVAGSTETPEHSLPKTEYPFDETGNYVAAWAASGESRFGKASSTWAAIVNPALEAMHAAQVIKD
jgi:endogenous inhibitor of DNA gyrase (YacG/DUF329 family)